MSRLIIFRDMFPHVIPAGAKPGDELTLVITGRIRRMEDDLFDVTQLGEKPSFLTSRQEVELNVTNIEPA